MRFSHLLTIALLAAAATQTSARAATTYAWPLSINLPLNLTIGPGSVISGVSVSCTDTKQSGTNAGKAMSTGVTELRVPATVSGTGTQITYTYSGTMKLVVSGGANSATPPATGDVITCKLNFNQPHGANWTYSGPVSLTLP